MANQPDRLDAMLDLVEANARMVINAADERPEAPQRNEVWWPFLIQRFGDEDALFRRIRLDVVFLTWRTSLSKKFRSSRGGIRGRCGQIESGCSF